MPGRGEKGDERLGGKAAAVKNSAGPAGPNTGVGSPLCSGGSLAESILSLQEKYTQIDSIQS
jgi:hypothetical protein